jgi:hypothetical protein
MLRGNGPAIVSAALIRLKCEREPNKTIVRRLLAL